MSLWLGQVGNHASRMTINLIDWLIVVDFLYLGFFCVVVNSTFLLFTVAMASKKVYWSELRKGLRFPPIQAGIAETKGKNEEAFWKFTLIDSPGTLNNRISTEITCFAINHKCSHSKQQENNANWLLFHLLIDKLFFLGASSTFVFHTTSQRNMLVQWLDKLIHMMVVFQFIEGPLLS